MCVCIYLDIIKSDKQIEDTPIEFLVKSIAILHGPENTMYFALGQDRLHVHDTS
jgi:hypothetical protein